jgi:hypothetical protein
VLEPTGEEGLAGAVLAADRLKRASARCRRVEVEIDSDHVAVDADGEELEAAAWDSAATKSVDDLAALEDVWLGHGQAGW